MRQKRKLQLDKSFTLANQTQGVHEQGSSNHRAAILFFGPEMDVQVV